MAATAIQGKKIIYMYRPKSEEGKAAGKRLMLTTENSLSISIDADATATKDGSVRTPGVPEIELSATALLSKGDTMIKALKKAMISGEKIEIWEANLDESTSDGKYAGTYYEGYLTECETSSPADDFVEVSLTFGIEGVGAEGNVTVPDNVVEEATYVFKDTTAGE